VQSGSRALCEVLHFEMARVGSQSGVLSGRLANFISRKAVFQSFEPGFSCMQEIPKEWPGQRYTSNKNCHSGFAKVPIHVNVREMSDGT
jgi:hypothetical protein